MLSRKKGKSMKPGIMPQFALALTAVALPTQAIAAEQCVTAAEAQNIMTAVIPDVLDGMMKQCAPSVPAKGFFKTSGPALVSRYRVSGDKAWPEARKAFFKMAGNDKSMATLSALPDDMVKGLISIGISSAMADDIKPADCPKVERVVEALAPLPPENTATLIGVFMEMGANRSAEGKSTKGFKICPTSPAPTPTTASK
jgi:hypothetical protein